MPPKVKTNEVAAELDLDIEELEDFLNEYDTSAAVVEDVEIGSDDDDEDDESDDDEQLEAEVEVEQPTDALEDDDLELELEPDSPVIAVAPEPVVEDLPLEDEDELEEADEWDDNAVSDVSAVDETDASDYQAIIDALGEAGDDDADVGVSLREDARDGEGEGQRKRRTRRSRAQIEADEAAARAATGFDAVQQGSAVAPPHVWAADATPIPSVAPIPKTFDIGVSELKSEIREIVRYEMARERLNRIETATTMIAPDRSQMRQPPTIRIEGDLAEVLSTIKAFLDDLR